MPWIQKNAPFLFFILLVYGAYFLFHQHPHQSSVQILGAENNLTLFTQPEDGRKPILDALESAQKDILVEMYILTDRQIISALEKEKEKGVQVQVILEQHPFGAETINNKTKDTLEQAGIPVAWSNPEFSLTHEKGIVIDDSETLILNQNLSGSSFGKNREFNIIDNNPQDAGEVKKIFEADWNRSSFTPSAGHIIESPDTDRQALTSLIKQSIKEIDIEMEIIDDKEIVSLLSQKAKTAQIKIILPSLEKIPANTDTANTLKQAGVSVKTISKPYIHAKMVLADNLQAYIGSINFSSQSMDQNRELGIIISQSDVVQNLTDSFESDWAKAQSL